MIILPQTLICQEAEMDLLRWLPEGRYSFVFFKNLEKIKKDTPDYIKEWEDQYHGGVTQMYAKRRKEKVDTFIGTVKEGAISHLSVTTFRIKVNHTSIMANKNIVVKNKADMKRLAKNTKNNYIYNRVKIEIFRTDSPGSLIKSLFQQGMITETEENIEGQKIYKRFFDNGRKKTTLYLFRSIDDQYLLMSSHKELLSSIYHAGMGNIESELDDKVFIADLKKLLKNSPQRWHLYNGREYELDRLDSRKEVRQVSDAEMEFMNTRIQYDFSSTLYSPSKAIYTTIHMYLTEDYNPKKPIKFRAARNAGQFYHLYQELRNRYSKNKIEGRSIISSFTMDKNNIKEFNKVLVIQKKYVNGLK